MKNDDIEQIVSDVIDKKKLATEAKIIEFKDVILKEIRDMRDEVILVTGYKDQIEDHEDRIITLEKTSGISTP